MWGKCILVLLGAQFLLALVRIPRTVDKKLAEISEYQELGRSAFPFRGHAPESAAVVDQLIQSTPSECLLYYEGAWKGDLELAAALLYPRLLIRFDPERPRRDGAFGRRFARIKAGDGAARLLVIQGRGKSLGLRRQ